MVDLISKEYQNAEDKLSKFSTNCGKLVESAV